MGCKDSYSQVKATLLALHLGGIAAVGIPSRDRFKMQNRTEQVAILASYPWSILVITQEQSKKYSPALSYSYNEMCREMPIFWILFLEDYTMDSIGFFLHWLDSSPSEALQR